MIMMNANFLMRAHIDRIATHVISITMNVGNTSTYWPLEVINHQGDTFRYAHEPGTMVLYESLSVIHGHAYPLPKGPHLGVFVHFAPMPWAEISDRFVRVKEQQKRMREIEINVVNELNIAVQIVWDGGEITIERNQNETIEILYGHRWNVYGVQGWLLDFIANDEKPVVFLTKDMIISTQKKLKFTVTFV